jgi:hypothetical protein
MIGIGSKLSQCYSCAKETPYPGKTQSLNEFQFDSTENKVEPKLEDDFEEMKADGSWENAINRSKIQETARTLHIAEIISGIGRVEDVLGELAIKQI